MRYLLDTCVISEMVKLKPNKRVLKWISDCHDETLFLSVLTMGEIYKGIAKLRDSKKKEKLLSWVKSELCNRFEGRILEITESVAKIWGELLGKEEKKGHKIPAIESLIAATGLAHNLTVVSRNVKDIEQCGVSVFNPWDSK